MGAWPPARIVYLHSTLCAGAVRGSVENPMTGNEMVPTLMFGTFGVVLIVAIGALFWFLRKRTNREAFKRAHGVDEDLGERK